MSDLIDRQAAVNALKQLQKAISGDYTELDPMVMAGCGYIGDCIGELEDLPSAQPEPQWIPCNERLPEVTYDTMGNWRSSEVILLMDDGEFTTVCNGHFNPAGVFEVNEADGPSHVGRPGYEVIAWMPLPKPYEEGSV